MEIADENTVIKKSFNDLVYKYNLLLNNYQEILSRIDNKNINYNENNLNLKPNYEDNLHFKTNYEEEKLYLRTNYEEEKLYLRTNYEEEKLYLKTKHEEEKLQSESSLINQFKIEISDLKSTHSLENNSLKNELLQNVNQINYITHNFNVYIKSNKRDLKNDTKKLVMTRH